MADLYPVAGAKIYIGGVLATKSTDFIESDFTSQTWVEIDGWQSAGATGDTSANITTQLINRGRDVKQKGTRNAGTMENRFAIIAGDAGQAALIAAEKTKSNYAFKVVYDDKITGGGTGSEEKFIALVADTARANGEANTIRMMNGNLDINSNIVIKAAT